MNYFELTSVAINRPPRLIVKHVKRFFMIQKSLNILTENDWLIEFWLKIKCLIVHMETISNEKQYSLSLNN